MEIFVFNSPSVPLPGGSHGPSVHYRKNKIWLTTFLLILVSITIHEEMIKASHSWVPRAHKRILKYFEKEYEKVYKAIPFLNSTDANCFLYCEIRSIIKQNRSFKSMILGSFDNWIAAAFFLLKLYCWEEWFKCLKNLDYRNDCFFLLLTPYNTQKACLKPPPRPHESKETLVKQIVSTWHNCVFSSEKVGSLTLASWSLGDHKSSRWTSPLYFPSTIYRQAYDY